MSTRLVVAVLMVLAVAAGLAALSAGGTDLAAARDWVARLGPFAEEHSAALMAGFFAIYVLSVSLSLPVATLLTLAGGALFGFWTGLVLVSFASTIGATCAFLVARWLARDWVAARFGSRLAAANEAFRRDGALYLFTLRLVPAVAFFVVNLVMALTPIRTRVFYGVSQLAMLPATAVYVNAGTRLAQVERPSDILSPGLIAALALLGLLPWALRLLAGAVRRWRLYRPWRRPARYDRNLVVIGAGAAGLVASYIGAAAQAKVTLVEQGAMGGDCLNHGCVPSKTLIRSARVAATLRHASDWGIDAGTPRVDFPAVMRRVREVIARIAPHDSEERYRSLGVEVLNGRARLIDPWTVEITGADGVETRTARSIVLATGSVPRMPEVPGIGSVAPLTPDTLWDAMDGRAEVPGRMVVLGGGAVGCELAQAFARLGTAVVLVQRGPRLLPREDPEAASAVRAALERDGIEVLTGAEAVACGTSDGRWIEVRQPSGTRRIGFDELLIAAGRVPRMTGFGLEELGLATDGFAETDGFLRTRLPHILAAGDVAGPHLLTHAAGHQGWFAAMNGLLAPVWRFRADYSVLPRVLFTEPELAVVGLTEAEARDRGIAIEVTRYGFDDADRAIAEGRTEGWIKVLTPPGRDRILGVTILGPEAGELIAEFALAMRHRIGLGGVLRTVHAYPTLAEANKAVAGAWQRGHVSPRLLGLARRLNDWRRG